MLFAHAAGCRVRPTPGAKAECSLCGASCVAKCGSIVTWHWAHASRKDCDTWSEGETEWHFGWKTRAADHEIEVTVGPHRADIKLARGLVIELQHSAISPAAIVEREAFYGRMIWLFDGAPFRSRFYLRDRGEYHSFRWSSPRKSLFAARHPIFIDFGSHVFEVKKLHAQTPCGGWGVLHKKPAFLSRVGLRALSAAEERTVARVTVEVFGGEASPLAGGYAKFSFTSPEEAVLHWSAEERRIRVEMWWLTGEAVGTADVSELWRSACGRAPS